MPRTINLGTAANDGKRCNAVIRSKQPTFCLGAETDLLSIMTQPHEATSQWLPLRTGAMGDKKQPFTATVVVGQRLEPWIESITTP